MKTEDVVILVAVAVGAALLFKKSTTWNSETLRTALSNAGATTADSVYTPGATMATIDNTTFKFNPGDENKLNFAQKTLITLDKIVPGTWLTKAVLT